MQDAYDLVGDIHGQGAKLDGLLRALGYYRRRGVWVPPEGRKAVFLGDLIDRGPDQVRVVDDVRGMIDAGYALGVMGNHEFNAIAYATRRGDGCKEYLRVHSSKNNSQHAAFLDQVGEGSQLHRELVKWFRTLPPYLELGDLRVVHAWWHQPYVDRVKASWQGGAPIPDPFLLAACTKNTPEWEAMEGLTKGMEVELPDGHSFVDHAGIERRNVRTRWWHQAPRSLRDIAIVTAGQEDRVPDHPLPEGYPTLPLDGPPVFIGHYWMTGTPVPASAKVACLDWSAGKSGPLVAYRWDGEQEILQSNFVAVR